MKKILLSATILCSCVLAQAQQTDYTPLVREGVKWIYHELDVDCIEGTFKDKPFEVYFKGDTTINGFTYKKCYKRYTSPIQPEQFVAIMGEQEKVVYLKWPDFDFDNVMDFSSDEKGTKLIDFNSPFNVNPFFDTPDPEEIEPITINDVQCKRFIVDKGNSWERLQIEGVGFDYDFRSGNYGGVIYMPYNSSGESLIWTEYRFDHLEDSEGDVIYQSQDFAKWTKVYDEDSATHDIKVMGPVDDSYYNLMGQPVAHPEDAPGIYIHEGKKVVVK